VERWIGDRWLEGKMVREMVIGGEMDRVIY